MELLKGHDNFSIKNGKNMVKNSKKIVLKESNIEVRLKRSDNSIRNIE